MVKVQKVLQNGQAASHICRKGNSHLFQSFQKNMWLKYGVNQFKNYVMRLTADSDAPPKCMYSSVMVTEELHRLTLPTLAKKHHHQFSDTKLL